MAAAIEEIGRAAQRPVLVVCHGGVIREARRVLLGEPRACRSSPTGRCSGCDAPGPAHVRRARGRDVRRVLRHPAPQAHAAAGERDPRDAALLAELRRAQGPRARVLHDQEGRRRHRRRRRPRRRPGAPPRRRPRAQGVPPAVARMGRPRRRGARGEGREVSLPGRAAPGGSHRHAARRRREGRDAARAARAVDRPGASTVASPETFPNGRGEPMRVRLFVPGRDAGVLVYRTDTQTRSSCSSAASPPARRPGPGTARARTGAACRPAPTSWPRALARQGGQHRHLAVAAPTRPAVRQAPGGQGRRADHVARRRPAHGAGRGDGRRRVPRRLRRAALHVAACAAWASAIRARTGPARARAWSSRRRAASPACTSSRSARATAPCRCRSPCSPSARSACSSCCP